jgi:transposase
MPGKNGSVGRLPLFRDGRKREREDGQAVQAELYEQIGRLKMEVEWLKKKSARCI